MVKMIQLNIGINALKDQFVRTTHTKYGILSLCLFKVMRSVEQFLSRLTIFFSTLKIPQARIKLGISPNN